MMSFRLKEYFSNINNFQFSDELNKILLREISRFSIKYQNSGSVLDILDNNPEALIDLKTSIEKVMSEKLNIQINMDVAELESILRNTAESDLNKYAKMFLNKINPKDSAN